MVEGYAGSVENYGTGLGLGSWGGWIPPIQSDVALLEPRQKPFAYGAFVAMVLGIPGAAALAYALISVAWRCLRVRSDGFAWAALAVAFEGIIINSPASLPTYWVILVFALSLSAPQKREVQRQSRQTVVPALDIP